MSDWAIFLAGGAALLLALGASIVRLKRSGPVLGLRVLVTALAVAIVLWTFWFAFILALGGPDADVYS